MGIVINKSTSFVQEQKHMTKSNRFQHVTPQLIEQVAQNFGFNLVSLKTGQARNAERADHQTTIARYRHESEMKIGGLNVELVFKVPHLYGAIEGFLGTYRQICSNGLSVGVKFDQIKIKHLGNPIEELYREIPRLVAQSHAMFEDIQRMQDTTLSLSSALSLASQSAMIRLDGVNNIAAVNSAQLLTPNRESDASMDLWTQFNLVQENIFRRGVSYQALTTNFETNETSIRNMTTRRVNPASASSITLNGQLWDVASSLIAA